MVVKRVKRNRGGIDRLSYAPRALAVYKGPLYCGYVLSC